MTKLTELPEEIQQFRDQKWRRDEVLKIEKPEQVEAMIEDLGFCLTLTDSRTDLPSVYIAVCGRRDVHAPRNVQKDYEVSLAWTLKDEVMMRGKVYYGKLCKGRAMFVAPRLIPYFNAIWGVPKKDEKKEFSEDALRILKVLRKEWEMGTSDLRDEAKIEKRTNLTKELDKLQRALKVIPQEVLYQPKFTYIWTLPEARFPKEMAKKVSREIAVKELAKAYLEICGMTLLGDFARNFGLTRKEAGKANHQLVNEGFARRIQTGIYKLRNFDFRIQ